MSLYLDTSSLLKIFVDEDGSEEMRRLVDVASQVATSIVTYAEARSALARMKREKRLSSVQFEDAKRKLEEHWRECETVRVLDGLIREAGELAERYRLKGCDGVQLASYAKVVRDQAPDEVQFSTHDKKLDRAARALASRLAGKRPPWVENVSVLQARARGMQTGENETGRRV